MDKVRKIEEILNDVKTQNDIPGDYELLETYAFLCLKKIIIMYQNNQITKEQSQNLKQKIEGQYNKSAGEYQFRSDLYEKHIRDIKQTESLRIKLRKELNSEETITEQRLSEILMLCLEIIGFYSGEVFQC